MKVILGSEIKEIVILWQKYFKMQASGGDGEKTADGGRELVAYASTEETLEGRLALTIQDFTSSNWLEWGERALINEIAIFPEIDFLSSHARVYQTASHNNSSFLNSVLRVCAQCQKEYGADSGEKMKWHGHFLTSLIVWACERIDAEGDVPSRRYLLERFIHFLTRLMDLEPFRKGRSEYDHNLVSAVQKVLQLVHERAIEDEDYLKSNQLREALKKLDVRNFTGMLNQLLLKLAFNLDVPVDFIEDLQQREYNGRRIAEMSYDDFYAALRANLIGKETPSTRLLLSSREMYDFIVQQFLRPSEIPNILDDYHRNGGLKGLTATNVLLVKDVQKMMRLGVAQRPALPAGTSDDGGSLTVPQVEFPPSFPVLHRTNSNLDVDVVEALNAIFEVRNRLEALGYYHKRAQGINAQAGNLAKIFARKELMAWYTMLEDCFRRVMEFLERLKSSLDAKYKSQQKELEKGKYAEWVANYRSSFGLFMALIYELKALQEYVNLIRRSMSIEEVKKDLKRFKQDLEVFSIGLQEIFGCDVQNPLLQGNAFESVIQKLKIYEEFAALEGERDMLRLQNQELQETALALKDDDPRQKFLELNKKLNKEKQASDTELSRFRFKDQVTHAFPSMLKKKGVDDNDIRLVEGALNRILDKEVDPNLACDFVTEVIQDKYLLKALLAVNRAEFYREAYDKFNQNSSIFARFGHFHGEAGRDRARKFVKDFMQEEKASFIESLVKEMFEAYQTTKPSSLGLPRAYYQGLKRLRSIFDKHYHHLKGGNKSTHSWRTYLFAYRTELDHAIGDVEGYRVGDKDFFVEKIESMGEKRINETLKRYEFKLNEVMKKRKAAQVEASPSVESADSSYHHSLV